jgi:hypothetical protein
MNDLLDDLLGIAHSGEQRDEHKKDDVMVSIHEIHDTIKRCRCPEQIDMFQSDCKFQNR